MKVASPPKPPGEVSPSVDAGRRLTEEMIIQEARRRHRLRLAAFGGALVLLVAGTVAVGKYSGSSSNRVPPHPELSARPAPTPVSAGPTACSTANSSNLAGVFPGLQSPPLSPPPQFLSDTVLAAPLLETPVPYYLPAGTAVPKADIIVACPASGTVSFGLAFLLHRGGSTYPAISTDGGKNWRVDGPVFHQDAAQGPLAVASIGILGTNAAYFWGSGGNAVRITTDGGLHWQQAWFGAGVKTVSFDRGTMYAVAFGDEVDGGSTVQKFLFASTDSGGTWQLRGQLPNGW